MQKSKARTIYMALILCLLGVACSKAKTPGPDTDGKASVSEKDNASTDHFEGTTTDSYLASETGTVPVEDGFLLASAKYPDGDSGDSKKVDRDAFISFVSRTAPAMLNASGKNAVYSPLGLYSVLTVIAEISDGNTRKQIMDILGQNYIDTLGRYANDIWKASYKNSKFGKNIVASSLWAGDISDLNKDMIESVAQKYYASIYSGDPLSKEYNQCLRDWINEQTDGLLKDSTEKIEMDPLMVLDIVNTINFQGSWYHPFSEDKTTEGIFCSGLGENIKCSFMHEDIRCFTHEENDFCTAVLEMHGGCSVRFILPSANTSADELMKKQDFWDVINTADLEKDDTEVELSLPRTDVSADVDMKECLKSLGMTDAFNAAKADFTPIYNGENTIEISSVDQASRVMFDEKGCKAVAYTFEEFVVESLPIKRMEMCFDRPFIFEVIVSDIPVFVGIVNEPVEE